MIAEFDAEPRAVRTRRGSSSGALATRTGRRRCDRRRQRLHGDLVVGEQLARGAALRGGELEQTAAGAYILQRFVVRFQQAPPRRGAREPAPGRRRRRGFGVPRRRRAARGGVRGDGPARSSRARRARDARAGRVGVAPRRVLARGGRVVRGCRARWPTTASCSRSIDDLLDAVRRPCRRVRRRAVPCSGPRTTGSAASTARSDDPEPALEHFAQATLMSQRMNAPFWVAESMVLQCAGARRARASRRRGSRSTRLVRGARALAYERGYGRVLAQAEVID